VLGQFLVCLKLRQYLGCAARTLQTKPNPLIKFFVRSATKNNDSEKEFFFRAFSGFQNMTSKKTLLVLKNLNFEHNKLIFFVFL
jgi:hypothetical protein